MLYYDLSERLSKMLIFLTSGIRADGDMRYGGVVQAQTKVQGVSMDKGF
jgi:hypothetical protein